jgi:cell wall-associated protease
VILCADRSVPRPAGTTISWTATPRGGIGPYQYKWLLYNGSEWDVVKNWSKSNTLRWTPAFANPRYRVSVWVRHAGNAVDEFEARTEAAFAIDEVPSTAPLVSSSPAIPINAAPVSPVSTVSLSCDHSSPQPAGTTITWRATATGGGAGRQYRWFVYDGKSWTTAAPWSTSDTFLWTPSKANSRYRIAIWARRAGSTRDYFEACAEVGFTIVESQPAST